MSFESILLPSGQLKNAESALITLKDCVSSLQSNTEYLSVQESEMLCQVHCFCQLEVMVTLMGLDLLKPSVRWGFVCYLVHVT